MARRVSLAQQIEEVERSIAHRETSDAKDVAAGKMRQTVADYHLDRLRAARASLVWLERNELLIKQRCGAAHA